MLNENGFAPVLFSRGVCHATLPVALSSATTICLSVPSMLKIRCLPTHSPANRHCREPGCISVPAWPTPSIRPSRLQARGAHVPEVNVHVAVFDHRGRAGVAVLAVRFWRVRAPSLNTPLSHSMVPVFASESQRAEREPSPCGTAVVEVDLPVNDHTRRRPTVRPAVPSSTSRSCSAPTRVASFASV